MLVTVVIIFINRDLAIPPRWLSTRLSVSRCCCTAAKHGSLANVTSRLFKVFNVRCFQTILGVCWRQKIPHTDMFLKGEITLVEHLLAQRQVRWLRHLIRLPDNRLLHRLLYSELSQGQQSAGGPKKRFLDHIRVTLQKCNIQLSEFEASARDRDVWSTVCEAGLSDFMNGWASTSMKRRAARHAATVGVRINGFIFGFTQLIAPTILSSAMLSLISTDFSSNSINMIGVIAMYRLFHCCHELVNNVLIDRFS